MLPLVKFGLPSNKRYPIPVTNPIESKESLVLGEVRVDIDAALVDRDVGRGLRHDVVLVRSWVSIKLLGERIQL